MSQKQRFEPELNNAPKNSFVRSGYVIIDKPKGLSSAVVVGKVKRRLGAVKVGHAGTLDPDATGLLVCLVNGATKIAPYIAEGVKVYEGTFRFGVTTSSDDMAGKIIATSESIPAEDDVQKVAASFIGEIQQIPPRVSAIQVGGRRAYDMERKGAEFELAARNVEIHSIKLQRVDDFVYSYEISCGAGTYIRSIARDIGEQLGCGGVVETLRRVASGPAHIAQSIQLEDLSEGSIVDWPALLPHLPIVDLPLQLSRDLLQGREYALEQVTSYIESAKVAGGSESVIYREVGRNESCGILKRIPTGWVYMVSAMPQFGLGK